MSEKTWTVYSLASGEFPDRVRYIGITSQPVRRRLAQHKNDHRPNHRTNWIRSVLSSGHDLVMSVVADGLTESAAKAMEVCLIASNSSELVNATAGGDGNVGWNPTAETRARMSESASRAMTPEHRARLSKIQKGLVTEETRDAVSAYHRGKTISLEMRRSVSVAMKRVAAMRPPRSGAYKGVHPNNNKWQASITVDGVAKHLGTFITPEAAAYAYDAAARAVWGEHCYLNFPTEGHLAEKVAA